MIDKGLIDRFRNIVNESDFVLFKYINNNEKNHWNCICSAMDWITVASEYICTEPPSGSLGSIETYAYISSVDIIVEAVQQLHRVLYNTKTPPFSNESAVFYDNQFGQTDMDYFKTIRACFGAHPVNLIDPSANDDPTKKRFASWSGGFASDGDFSVFLYSNQIDGQNLSLDIYFYQIDAFLEKYYNYLESLIVEIKRQRNEFNSNFRKRKIQCSGNPLEQLSVLRQESVLRLNNTYYKTTLDALKRLFETPVSSSNNIGIVCQYHTKLIVLIEEIQTNLQNMRLTDLKYGYLLHLRPKGLPDGWGYWIEKLSEYVGGAGHHPCTWESEIKELFSGLFELRYESYNELYLLVNAALYQLHQQNSECLSDRI